MARTRTEVETRMKALKQAKFNIITNRSKRRGEICNIPEHMEKKNNVDVVCSCDRKEIRCYGEQRDNSSLGEMHGNRTGSEFVNKWHAKTLIRGVFYVGS